MRQTLASAKSNDLSFSPTPAARGLLQRKCACGTHTIGGSACDACAGKDKTLRRRAARATEDVSTATAIPPVVHDVLRSPGQPLDVTTRSLMESGFGHDFSRVRAHTDAKAAESAHAVNAMAYTVGSDIIFGAGMYAPSTAGGRRLLAHELTHVAQQRGPILSPSSLGISTAHDPSEREADAAAERVAAGGFAEPVSAQPSPALRRTLKVTKPADKIDNPTGTGLVQTNADTVQNYLGTICGAGNVTVDPTSGVVDTSTDFCTRPPATFLGIQLPWKGSSPAQLSSTPTGCGCLCDMVHSANSWRILVDDKDWPHTSFDNHADAKKPGGTGGVVTTPSPNSPKLWGAAAASGKALDIDPWLVLGHELCGHGWLGDSGKHAPDETSVRGEGGHQATVARENLLRSEHGIELRGTFKQPHCGESYWRDKATGGPVNWSSAHALCEQWRKEYNKKNKTNYSIADTIP